MSELHSSPPRPGGATHRITAHDDTQTGNSRADGRHTDDPTEDKVETKLPVPPDVEPPTMGWPAFQYRRNVKKQKTDPKRPGYLLVPAPNKKEQALRDERDYIALLDRSRDKEVSLTKERTRAKVAFIGPKGNSAKTTSTIWTATGLCVETGVEVTVFDGNFASGRAAQRLRLEGELTSNERQVIDNFDRLSKTHGDFNEYVRGNTDRVRVVGARPTIEGGRKLSADQYAKVAQLSFENCDYLYIDTTNDITSDQCLALLKLADLIVFVANVGEQDSLRLLGTSMQSLRGFGLVDKVNKSVVLINNLPPGRKPSDYLDYQHEVNMENEVIQHYPGHTGPWVGIRHDRAIADAKPVIWSDLQRETAQDIRMVNITILQQLPTKQELRELKRSQHPEFNPNQMGTTVESIAIEREGGVS